MKNKWLLSPVFYIYVSLSGCASQSVNNDLPQEQEPFVAPIEINDQTVISPDKKWLVCTEWEAYQDDYLHVVLKSKEGDFTKSIYHFDRSVTVLWAPNSTQIAINDNCGSDVTNCYVYNINSDKVISLDTESLATFNNRYPSFDHIYAHVIWWSKNSKTVIVRVHGHNNWENGEAFFLVDVNNGKLSREIGISELSNK